MKTFSSRLSLALAGLVASSLMLRAQDPIPPTPPGSSKAPAASSSASAASSTTASASKGTGNGQRGGERLQAMKEKLGLTQEQVAKLKPIFEKEGPKMKAIREDSSLSQEQKREKMGEAFKSLMEQIKPILTADQLAKWKEEMEKRRAERAKK